MPQNHPPIRTAVMIAAGRGVRLHQRDTPKCLVPVAGRPVLSWLAEGLAQAGVNRLVMVLGHEADALAARVEALTLPVELTTLVAPGWERGNGATLAAARGVVTDDRFALLMSDHLVSAAHFTRLFAGCDGDAGGVLATSPVDTPGIDLADATKVLRDEDGVIRAIGKDLASYNALDTGVFVFGAEIFEALAAAARAAKFSLTDANRVLIAGARLRSVAVDGLQWQDIDTPDDLALAERDAASILAQGSNAEGIG